MTIATRYIHGNNSGPYTRRPKIVVMHSTRSTIASKTDAQELESTLNWFTNPLGASSHWVLSELERVRVVTDDLIAWHSSYFNDDSWGLELTQPTIDRPFTDGHYDNLALVGQRYVSLGVAPVWLSHWDGNLEASGFVAHENTVQGQGSGKTDPGPEFYQVRFIDSLEVDMTPQEVRDIVRAMEFRREDDAGTTHQPKNTLARWLWELDEHRKDDAKHSAGSDDYTDADAVKAVKDAL